MPGLQIFNTPSGKAESDRQIGYNAGQSLSDSIFNYSLNRDLNNVINDPQLKNAPTSERFQRLSQALQPYGEKGLKQLQNQMQFEEIQNQEKQEKISRKKGDILRRRLSSQPITDEEKEMFTPEEEMAIAKHEQALKIAELKAKGSMTQASQPINPDQLRRIQEVRRTPEYQAADPAKKTEMLKDNGVSKENSDSEVKPYIELEKNKPGGKYAEVREKSIADLVTDTYAQRKSAVDLSNTINTAKKVLGGDIAQPGIKALLKNNPYGQLLMGLTPDESRLQTLNKKMLEGTKGLFGPKPTENEIFLLLNGMLPSIGKTPEANKASLDLIEKANNLVIQRGDLLDEITDGGRKYVPNVESELDKRMRPLMQEFESDVIETDARFGDEEGYITRADGKIKVRNAKGEEGWITKEQIDKAAADKVIFTPIKKK